MSALDTNSPVDAMVSDRDARRAHHGSLIKAIESLRSSGRSLVPYAPDEPSDIEHQIVDSELLDPERATSLGKRMLSFLRFRPEPFR
jgi:hypothetical protein